MHLDGSWSGLFTESLGYSMAARVADQVARLTVSERTSSSLTTTLMAWVSGSSTMNCSSSFHSGWVLLIVSVRFTRPVLTVNYIAAAKSSHQTDAHNIAESDVPRLPKARDGYSRVTTILDQVGCKVEAGLPETGGQIWLCGTAKALVCNQSIFAVITNCEYASVQYRLALAQSSLS